MLLRPLVIAAFITLTQGQAAPASPQADGVDRALPIPFSSNGCSGFRDAKFFSCCFVHDFNYWSGGTWSDRSKADRNLWSCVFTISGERVVADIGYFLLRLGILPGAFVKDGWGRAWYETERSRYAPLTPEQQQMVAAERARVCASLKPDADGGRFWVDEKRQIRARQARELCGGDPLRR
jgi:hypothetical protein